MKAISKQGQQCRANHFAIAPLRRTLENMSAKNFPGNDGGFRSSFMNDSLLQKSARVARRASIAKKQNAADATIKRLQENLKEMEAELNVHRYYIERQVEQRTEQLMKRISVLESCNATLVDKLALANKELVALKQQSAELDVQTAQAPQSISAAPKTSVAQPDDCIEQLDSFSDWARNMIGWRVSAAGAIA